jgi:hypothetical protein
MIIIKTLLLSFVLLFIALPQVAHAQIFNEGCDGVTGSALCEEVKNNSDPLTGTNGILMKAVNIILFAIGIAATIMIIIGGIKYVTSSGDTANVNNAKNTILYAVVGLAIAVIAKPLLGFVVGLF